MTHQYPKPLRIGVLPILLGTLLSLLIAIPSIAQTIQMEIKTNKGSFRVMLYDDTPIHRDRFVDLVQSKSYDGTLFHRVIEMFMVQGGNLMTQGKKGKDVDVSIDTMSLTLPAEIMPQHHFHKRGALCAAREGDDTNPEKRSSGSQFYIVTGDHYTDYDLSQLEVKYQRTFSTEQREAYKSVGGAPWLDGNYTVFGEVVSGIEVVEKIERVSTNTTNRPEKDVVIKSIRIIK